MPRRWRRPSGSCGQRVIKSRRGEEGGKDESTGQAGNPFGRRGCRAAFQKLYHPVSLALRPRSEEHTSELQSRPHLVCRLLLEKKNDELLESSAGDGRMVVEHVLSPISSCNEHIPLRIVHPLHCSFFRTAPPPPPHNGQRSHIP